MKELAKIIRRLPRLGLGVFTYAHVIRWVPLFPGTIGSKIFRQPRITTVM
jgi:hypothetical protein